MPDLLECFQGRSIHHLSGQCDFSNGMRTGLATALANSLRTQGCTSSGLIDLTVFTTVFVWSQTGFSVTVGGIVLPQSQICCPPSGETWEERLPVKTGGKERCGVRQPSPHPLLLGCQSCAPRVHTFFDLPFLADVPVEALILRIPCPVKLQQHLGPPDHIPTQTASIPRPFPRYLSLLPLPEHLLLVHQFDQQVSTMLVSFPPFLPN